MFYVVLFISFIGSTSTFYFCVLCCFSCFLCIPFPGDPLFFLLYVCFIHSVYKKLHYIEKLQHAYKKNMLVGLFSYFLIFYVKHTQNTTLFVLLSCPKVMREVLVDSNELFTYPIHILQGIVIYGTSSQIFNRFTLPMHHVVYIDSPVDR